MKGLVDFDVNALTVADATFIEEFSGLPIGELLWAVAGRRPITVKQLKAVALLQARRDDPDTPDDAFDGYDLKVLVGEKKKPKGG